MTFLAFRPFRRRKHRNDVIVTSYIKILQILKLKSKDITSKTLHAKFYASRIKNKRIRRGVKYAPPQVWSVFKSPGKIGLNINSKFDTFYVKVHETTIKHVLLRKVTPEQLKDPSLGLILIYRNQLNTGIDYYVSLGKLIVILLRNYTRNLEIELSVKIVKVK